MDRQIKHFLEAKLTFLPFSPSLFYFPRTILSALLKHPVEWMNGLNGSPFQGKSDHWYFGNGHIPLVPSGRNLCAMPSPFPAEIRFSTGPRSAYKRSEKCGCTVPFSSFYELVPSHSLQFVPGKGRKESYICSVPKLPKCPKMGQKRAKKLPLNSLNWLCEFCDFLIENLRIFVSTQWQPCLSAPVPVSWKRCAFSQLHA